MILRSPFWYHVMLPYGVGAVLSQRGRDGKEQPVAYASRTLSKAERNYAHLEKEGLAVIFGLTNFISTYLVGHLS